MKTTAIIVLFLASLDLRAEAKKPTGGVQIVTQLYREFAWEAVMSEPVWPADFLIDQPKEVLLRYFDETLATLIIKDRECAEKTHEVCNLDFVPLWNSQDPAATDLKITQGEGADLVQVSYRYPPSGGTIAMIYRLRKTKVGWRITDIEYGTSYTLLGILRGK